MSRRLFLQTLIKSTEAAKMALLSERAAARVSKGLRPEITDLTARDGKQALPFVPTHVKLGTLQRILQLPFARVEVTSLVSPKAIPQFADCLDVHEGVKKLPMASDAQLKSYLVLNARGAEQAVKLDVEEIGFVISPSPGFTEKNMGAKSLEEMDKRVQEIADIAKDLKRRVFVSTTFFDPYTKKPIDTSLAAEFVQRAAELGHEVAISDTTGDATRETLHEVFTKAQVPADKLAVHLHNTKKTALDNALFAFAELGIFKIDAAIAGIGKGCPFAPGASGNLDCFELIIGLEEIGVQTGINLREVFEIANYIFDNIPGLIPSEAYQTLREMKDEEREEFFQQLQPYLYEKEAEIPSSTAKPLDTSRAVRQEAEVGIGSKVG